MVGLPEIGLFEVFVAIVAVCLFAGAITVSLSAVLFWFDRRREAVRLDILPALFEQLEEPGPDAAAWYDGLSPIERYVVRRTVAQYL
ncbi:hypothetical protein [Halosolutus gelatinilyticus]|uniref:hypothetical protein n=1 Tax=Halosolutus gelatinilyticus TaxID=2931975 RepID=UPI001FF35E6C|nr:hypothetical protein [Halosolutus gelatinilyticus]